MTDQVQDLLSALEGVERAIVVCAHADDMVRESTPLAEIVSQVEKMSLSEALQAAEGDRNEAARMLALDRAAFYDKLQEYGLASQT